jgi:hypothetical protein
MGRAGTLPHNDAVIVGYVEYLFKVTSSRMIRRLKSDEMVWLTALVLGHA